MTINTNYSTNGEKMYWANCTAIAVTIGDTERQDAIYYAIPGDEIVECVVFGAHAADNAEALEIYEMADTQSVDSDDIETVRFDNGSSIGDYDWH